MEQQLDVFTQKRFELMVEMATKKLQQEISALKEQFASLTSEMGSLKSQISRIQFQPQQAHAVQKTLFDSNQNQAEQQNQDIQPKREVKIVDCRPENEKKGEFVSGSTKNSEPVKPRYGDYQPQDVSIEKFFYFGRK